MRIHVPKKMRTEITAVCDQKNHVVKPLHGTDYKKGRKELESISVAVSDGATQALIEELNALGINWNDIENYKKCYFDNKVRSLVRETFKRIIFEYPDVD